MNTQILLVALALLIAGCENAPHYRNPGPYVRPGLVMIPADQACLYGVPISPGANESSEPPPGYPATDVRSVQTESPVTAIHFNRYADPSRPDELMHEAHIVYRREGGPRWQLHPAVAGQQVLVGPRLTDGRSEVSPLASQELDAYVREQRANLQKQQQVMGQVTEGMRQLAEQQQQLAAEMTKLRTRSPSPALPSVEKPALPPPAESLPPPPSPSPDHL